MLLCSDELGFFSLLLCKQIRQFILFHSSFYRLKITIYLPGLQFLLLSFKFHQEQRFVSQKCFFLLSFNQKNSLSPFSACSVTRCLFGGKCVLLEDGTESCQCPRGCPLSYDPVCGSNKKTYLNRCALNLDRCLTNGTVALAYKGKCCKEISFLLCNYIFLNWSAANESNTISSQNQYPSANSCFITIRSSLIICFDSSSLNSYLPFRFS